MKNEKKKLTHNTGAPVADNQNVMTAGPRGPMLLQDVWFLEKLAHFDREVIPERRMHAKGSGAYGTFTVTHDIPCRGCRQQDGKHYHLPSEGCATLDCVKAKDVDLCCDCDDFPCAFLAPTAENAGRYPHNMKVYNLCRIKNVGLERWIEEEAGQIRKKYFTGKFVVGKGQAD